MDARVTGCDDIAFAGDGIAVPIADHAARAFDDGKDGRDIPAFEIGFNHQIHEAHRDQGIGITIAAIAGETAGAFDAEILFAFLLAEMQRSMGRANQRIGKRGAGPRAQIEGAARMGKKRLTGFADETLAQERLIEDAEYGTALML